MCMIRPQAGQSRSRTSNSQRAKSVSLGQRWGMVLTSLSWYSDQMLLKASAKDTHGSAWFLAGCLAVANYGPGGGPLGLTRAEITVPNGLASGRRLYARRLKYRIGKNRRTPAAPALKDHL